MTYLTKHVDYTKLIEASIYNALNNASLITSKNVDILGPRFLAGYVNVNDKCIDVTDFGFGIITPVEWLNLIMTSLISDLKTEKNNISVGKIRNCLSFMKKLMVRDLISFKLDNIFVF